MQFSNSFILAALPYLAAAAKTSRTFAVNRIQGKGLVNARMDPVVQPGGPSGHAHMVTGGNAFAVTMDDNVTSTATCANSLVKNDLSNYWIPGLYFQHPNGTGFTSVDMFYMNVYYFFEATDDDIKAFPRGFRMTSGDPFLRSPPSTGGKSILDPAQGPIQPVQITCPLNSSKSPRWPANSDGLHGVGIQDPQNAGAGVGFPNADCDGYASPMRLDVHFPSCYNPAAGLDDFKNNNAWPSSKGAKNGQNCPPGWVHLPHIFYEVYYNTPAFKDQWTQGQNSQPFVLAMGDPTGYGLHGDFMAGWDENTLQHIIDTCDAGDSGMDKCPDIPGGLVSSQAASGCTIQPANPQEQILGNLAQLPGCNPVVPAPGPAPKNPTCSGQAPLTTPSASPTLAPKPSGSGAPAAPSGAAPTTLVPSASPSAAADSSSASAPPVSTSAAPPSPSGSNDASTSNLQNLGCFVDSKDQRALSGPTINLQQNMTIPQCASFCETQGYSYAGLEYKSECYCGKTAPTQTSNACTDPCVGDTSTMCGGWNAISVYKVGNAKRSHEHAKRHRRQARRADLEGL